MRRVRRGVKVRRGAAIATPSSPTPAESSTRTRNCWFAGPTRVQWPRLSLLLAVRAARSLGKRQMGGIAK